MINFHERFFEILNTLTQINVFTSNYETFPDDTYHTLSKNNIIEQYYINSSKFNLLFSELFKIDLVDWQNLISFFNMTLEINNGDQSSKNIFITFEKSITGKFDLISLNLLDIDKHYKIKLDDETAIKELFNIIKANVYNNFEMIISSLGFNINNVTSKDINFIYNMSVSDYIQKYYSINKIDHLRYIDFEEAKTKIKHKNLNNKKRDITFEIDNITCLYHILFEILPCDKKNLKQIIELYKFYCQITNQNFEIKINFPKLSKNQKNQKFYYIYFKDFFHISVALDPLFESDNFLYENKNNYNETLTNSSDKIYEEILNAFLNRCSKILKKDVAKITYKDLDIIKILTL